MTLRRLVGRAGLVDIFGAAVIAASGLTAAACLNDSPVDPSGAGVQLALDAQVSGIEGQQRVEIRTFYRRADGAEILLPTNATNPDTVTVAPGETKQITLEVQLDPCLNDARREGGAEAAGCRLAIAVSLLDEAGAIDRQVVEVGAVRPGDKPAPPTLNLSPRLLTVEGGGPGTGSGMVAAPAAGGRPPFTCTITDGVAAASCTANYPTGTVVTLTATSGLTAWGGACSNAGPCQVTMSEARTVTASFAVAPPTTGSLAVTVAGLPPGVPAVVRVTGPGVDRPLTETGTLTELVPGNYTVAAQDVVSGDVTYRPSPPSQTVAVAAGQTAEATVAYNPPPAGSLTVAVNGLPEGVGAAVTVSGPNNFTQSLSGTQTLSGLAPGPYTITAADVGTADQTYAPAPRAQFRTVTAGQTTNATVDYSPTMGALTVTIPGLPPGVGAAVTVTGPGGFSQSLTGSGTLSRLAPGSYRVTAVGVTVGDSTYAPAPADQPVAISAGQIASATVTYSAQPRLTVNGAGTGSGRVTSQEDLSPAIDCAIAAGVAAPVGCSASYPERTRVVLTANADEGSEESETSRFTGWGGAGIDCGTLPTCTVTLDQARTVTARFDVLASLVVVEGGEGDGTGNVSSTDEQISCRVFGNTDVAGSCTATYLSGTRVTLTAEADEGSTFQGWIVDTDEGENQLCPGLESCTITLDQSHTVTAVFAQVFTLTVEGRAPDGCCAGQGTITGPAGLTPQVACTITAEGETTGTCSAAYPSGTTVTLTATVSGLNLFDSWGGDAIDCGTSNSCSQLMDRSRTVTAGFGQLIP